MKDTKDMKGEHEPFHGIWNGSESDRIPACEYWRTMSPEHRLEAQSCSAS